MNTIAMNITTNRTTVQTAEELRRYASERAAQIAYNYKHRFDAAGYREAIAFVAALIDERTEDDCFLGKTAEAIAEHYDQGINTVLVDATVYAVEGEHRG